MKQMRDDWTSPQMERKVHRTPGKSPKPSKKVDDHFEKHYKKQLEEMMLSGPVWKDEKVEISVTPGKVVKQHQDSPTKSVQFTEYVEPVIQEEEEELEEDMGDSDENLQMTVEPNRALDISGLSEFDRKHEDYLNQIANLPSME